MINLARTSIEIPKASNNLLPIGATFNNVNSWNYDANAVVENQPIKPYFGQRSLLVTHTSTNVAIFDYGSNGLQTTINPYGAGNHILAVRLFKEDATANIIFTIKMFINGVNTTNTTFTCDLFNSNGFVDGQWNTYFQNITLADNDVIDFSFESQSDTIGAKLFIDGFKLELDDRGLNYPSYYTENQQIILETTQSIDLGSISSNSYVTQVVTLAGARVGDFVEMVYPTELIDLGLAVPLPNVSDVDEITFLVHNHSGGAINPSAGNFTFKIVK